MCGYTFSVSIIYPANQNCDNLNLTIFKSFFFGVARTYVKTIHDHMNTEWQVNINVGTWVPSAFLGKFMWS